ncbi:Holliday junction branch migration protein RuvA [Pseudonocardiaceae bacterium YIM PH 21723]|nr:Holliday junction branch migration protein RuvA [Pseudonocardiaceae bacterium YIM PH 21723]
MISSVRGPVLSIGLDHAVIEVGGVGLEIRAIPSTLATLRRGEEVRLCTTLVVREDSLTLFGFADDESRQLFHLLQTTTGVGTKIALATLAVLEPDKLSAALAEGNLTVLTQVPGIGKKVAERMVVELRDKVAALAPVSGALPGMAAPVKENVVEALLGLGFAAKQAESAVDAVLAGGDTDTSVVLRKALSSLGRKR